VTGLVGVLANCVQKTTLIVMGLSCDPEVRETTFGTRQFRVQSLACCAISASAERFVHIGLCCQEPRFVLDVICFFCCSPDGDNCLMYIIIGVTGAVITVIVVIVASIIF